MALDLNGLETDIKSLLNEMIEWDNKANPMEHFATELSKNIEKYVKSGTVKVDAGIAVSTSGSASAQTGETTEEGTGKIE